MDINTIITLEDKSKYVLLDKVIKNKKKYFFAIKLDEEDNPTTEYEIFELEKNNKETFMNVVEDIELRENIFVEFTNNYINTKED